jgi:hypothetical protein
MSKRIIISIAAAALIAVPAQSASAAISKPVGPVAQEMDHGVAPTFDHGVGTSPGTSAPEATESVPTPSEQGISTSPGTVEPVTEPSDPEATAGDKDGESFGESCSELADEKAQTVGEASMIRQLGNALGGFGGPLLDMADRYDDTVWVIEEQEQEAGCTDSEEEPA